MKLDWVEIEKIITERASQEEVARFNEWLSESTIHQAQFEKMKNYYDNYENEEYNRSTTRDENHSPLMIIKNSKKRKRIFFVKRISVAAALLFLFFGIKFINDYTPKKEKIDTTIVAEETTTNKIQIINETGEIIKFKQLGDKGVNVNIQSKTITYNNLSDDKIEYHTLSVPEGETFILELCDGTTLNVNSNSEVKYPTKFLKGEPRAIFLKGEAFFDVTSNPEQQFIVSVDNVKVRVYGTKFNINSYKEIETVLLSGSVSVEVNGVETKIAPNQKATVNRDNETLRIENVVAEDYILWNKRYFTFENRRLEEIAAAAARWYGVEIKFKNESAKELIINCNLPKYEKIETFLDMIKKTNRIQYECVDSTYIIQ